MILDEVRNDSRIFLHTLLSLEKARATPAVSGVNFGFGYYLVIDLRVRASIVVFVYIEVFFLFYCVSRFALSSS